MGLHVHTRNAAELTIFVLFEFAPLSKAVQNFPFEPLSGYFINPHTMREWKTLSPPVLLADLDFRACRGFRPHMTKTVTVNSPGVLNGMVLSFELQAGSAPFLSTHPAVVG